MKWWVIVQLVGFKAAGLALVLASNWDVAGWSLFFAGGCIVMVHHLLPRAQGLCDVVAGFETTQREVWLTIDDGPDPEDTPLILSLLERHGAKATFFMIGARAGRHPELVRRVIQAGHTVGSHTFSHPLATFWCAGPRRVRRELDASLAVLAGAGATVRLFRPPAGIKNVFLRRLLRERGLRCVAWSLRSGDALGTDRAHIIERVRRTVRPGSLILMHEGASMAGAVRVHALEGVLRTLAEQGYRCVVPEPQALRRGGPGAAN